MELWQPKSREEVEEHIEIMYGHLDSILESKFRESSSVEGIMDHIAKLEDMLSNWNDEGH